MLSLDYKTFQINYPWFYDEVARRIARHGGSKSWRKNMDTTAVLIQQKVDELLKVLEEDHGEFLMDDFRTQVHHEAFTMRKRINCIACQIDCY